MTSSSKKKLVKHKTTVLILKDFRWLSKKNHFNIYFMIALAKMSLLKLIGLPLFGQNLIQHAR